MIRDAVLGSISGFGRPPLSISLLSEMICAMMSTASDDTTVSPGSSVFSAGTDAGGEPAVGVNGGDSVGSSICRSNIGMTLFQ